MPEGSEILDWIGQLPKAVQAAVLSEMDEISVPARRILYARGSEPKYIYRIVSGKVRLFIATDFGREILIKVFGPGESIGEVAAIDGGPYPVSTETQTDCKLLTLTIERFAQLRKRHPVINGALFKYLTSALRTMVGLMAEAATYTVPERVMATLVWLVAAAGARGESVERLEVTQRDLALMTGASRQAINRVLGDLQARGLIATDYCSIVVKDLPGLRATASRPE